jgi:DNA modification methylase
MSETHTKQKQISGIAAHCSFDRAVDLVDLVEHPSNPNKHSDKQIALLAKIIRNQGWRNPIVVSNRSGFIISGHGRLAAAKLLNVEMVPVDYQDFASEADEHAHLIADNRIAELAEIDGNELAGLLRQLDGQIDMELTGFDQVSLDDLLAGTTSDQPEVDAEPQIDKADELQAKWKTALGQVWELGEHRIACGDSTAPETLAKLMNKGQAGLLHADPPYGMGKEKDGVANDNLYRDKLDAFQMDWWRACRPHLEDNASAYIWGNAPDLWRLWYVGGLADSERLTFRSQVIWDKPPSASAWGSPIGSDKMRSFPHGYEVCLFFMLGEQGFNNNADNYWEGWEPIRAELTASCEAMGWSGKDVERITGVGMFGHWFTKSQWTFIPAEHYNKLRDAARGDAFKREHDELKREHDELKRDFYATRAYFDNTHDNMTDVWDYGRVTGEERHGHATPKPIEMMGRCIKSSTPSDAIVLEPFLGSGTTLMACENLNRKCYGIELNPGYVAVILQRWAEATGKEPKLCN